MLCSLSITDVLWAAFTIVKNSVTVAHEHFCPEGLNWAGKLVVVLCFFSTLANLSIISRDRYLAMSKPWWYRNHVTRSRVVKQASVIWVFSLIMSGIGATRDYSQFTAIFSAVITILFYAVFIITTIGCYVGILISNKRQRALMDQQAGQMLAVLRREKRLANTVDFILIAFCFTLIPALIAPVVLVQMGFSTGDGLIPFRPLYYVFVTLNGLLNPLLNYGRNEDVRRAVCRLITCRQGTGRVHPIHTESTGVNKNNLNSSNTENRVNAAIPLEQRSGAAGPTYK